MATRKTTARSIKPTAKGKSAGKIDAPQEVVTEAELAALRPLDVPIFYPAGYTVQVSGDNLSVVGNRPRPMVDQHGRPSKYAYAEAIVMLSLSPQSAKDLVLLLAKTLASFEKDRGEIHTAFSDRLKNESKTKKSR